MTTQKQHIPLPIATILEAVNVLFPIPELINEKSHKYEISYDDPPGWTICNEDGLTSGSFGAWPPGSKPGNSSYPHLSNASESLVIEDARKYIQGNLPLHHMRCTPWYALEILLLRINYRFGLIRDNETLKLCKKRWPNGK